MAMSDDIDWVKNWLATNSEPDGGYSPTEAIKAIQAKIARENREAVLHYCRVNYGYERPV